MHCVIEATLSFQEAKVLWSKTLKPQHVLFCYKSGLETA